MNHGADQPAVIDGQESEQGARADRLEDALDDPHCRYLIEYLESADEPATVAEVATYVVGRITDTDPDEVSTDVERRVQTWFYHGQLPMLDDYGVVDFDPDSGTVRLVDESVV